MPRRRAPDPATEDECVRIDKWLWAARFYKTRSMAGVAVEAGHVRIGGQRCKPGRNVRVGDIIELKKDVEEREVIVRGLTTLRGPATTAQTLYEETPDSLLRKTEAEALRKLAPQSQATTTGRPTKRDRRKLEHWKEHTE